MYNVVEYPRLEEKRGVLVLAFKEEGNFIFVTENVKQEFRNFCEWLQGRHDYPEMTNEDTLKRKEELYRTTLHQAKLTQNSFAYCVIEKALIIVNYTENWEAAVESGKFISENEEYFRENVLRNWLMEKFGPKEKNANDILNEKRAALKKKIEELPPANQILIKVKEFEYVLKSNSKAKLLNYCGVLINPKATKTKLPKVLQAAKDTYGAVEVEDIILEILE